MSLKSKWLLAILLFFITATDLPAQDKYVFATVFTLNMGTKTDGIYVSYSDREREFTYVKWDRSLLVQDYSLLLKRIQELSDMGWEIIAVADGKYHLKKKVN